MLLLVATVAALVYANSLKNGFAYDDLGVIKDNPHVVDLQWSSIWSDNYWRSTDGIQPDALYRPLTLWTYLVNQWYMPDITWPFHLVNVALHALVTLLVSLLAWRLLGDRLIAVTVGLLFAVHPLHTEVVANTVGRAELLAALWSLLALLIYLPQAPILEESCPERRPWWHGLLVAACFAAAMLSKESPATLIPAFVFIDAWRWLRLDRSSRHRLGGPIRWFGSQALRYYVPLCVAFALYLAARIHACGLMADAGSVHPIVNPLVQATVGQRIVTPFGLFARYLALTFWPLHLSADYSAPSILPGANPLAALPLIGILSCVLALILSVRFSRRLPQIALILGLLFFSYFLVSNAIRIGTIFGERLFYLPSAFILMLLSWGAVRLYQQALLRRALAARCVAGLLLVAAVGAMSLRTWIRNTDWADNLPLAVATGRDNPRSAKACFWAATVLIWTDKPEYMEIGKTLLDRSIELYPKFAAAQWEIAKYYGRKNDVAHSLIYLSHAVRMDPGTHMTRFAIAGILKDLQHAKPEAYMPVLEAEKAAHPDDETVYFAFALAYHAQGKFDLAEENAIKALSLGKGMLPGGRDQFHEAAAELASIRFDRGQIADAVAMFRQYVMRVTRSVDARCDMATMLLKLDTAEFPTAVAEAEMNLNRADAIEPANARVREVRGQVDRRRRELAREAIAGASSSGSLERVGPTAGAAGSDHLPGEGAGNPAGEEP
jgi:tetratricopeptide (TPR) repeat protein